MSLSSLKIWLISPLICLTVTVCASFSEAQEPDRRIEYRFISTTKIGTFEQELNEAARQGFKVGMVAQSMRPSSLTVLVFLDKTAKQRPLFEYRLLDPGQFKKQKAEIEKAGFTYCGDLLPPALFGLGSPPLLLLERQLTAPLPTQFELLELKKEKELEQKMNISAAVGFVPVSISPANALMQRDPGSLSAIPQKRNYRLLEVYRMSTLEKEMNSSAKEGYRFLLSGSLNSVIMKRELNTQEKGQFEYQLVPIRESEKSLQQLAAVAADGFNFVGVTQLGLTAIFERQTNNSKSYRPAEFKILETVSGATMGKEFVEAVAQGFLPLSIGHGAKGWISVLLSRESLQPKRN